MSTVFAGELEDAAVPMWRAQPPQAGRPALGFPVLREARQQTLWAPTREQGAYNHHPKLAWHGGRFHAMWSNHRHGEDGPGQRILYTSSADFREWGEVVELLPSPVPMRPSEELGLVCTAFAWRVAEGRLFAVCGLHANIGFTTMNGEGLVPERSAKHPRRARKGYSSLVREVTAEGFGPVHHFAGRELPEEELPFATTPLPADLATQIESTTLLPANWDFEGRLQRPDGMDGRKLCEPTVFRTAKGWRMLLRDLNYSHRLWVSDFDADGERWRPARPTDIPDSPSLSDTVNLPDGVVLLVGNQTAPTLDRPEAGHYPRDPLTVSVSTDGGETFGRCYALRVGTQAYRVSQKLVKGRGGGGQYPNALVRDGQLYVIYSMGKEDIAVSSVPLTALGLR